MLTVLEGKLQSRVAMGEAFIRLLAAEALNKGALISRPPLISFYRFLFPAETKQGEERLDNKRVSSRGGGCHGGYRESRLPQIASGKPARAEDSARAHNICLASA
ncbi:hypothetical protein GJAV_G00202780 [Gymnothorax javanicus]|nr:hypothetical protein GJAV_G00202780 [Gymnothorax javanicus]